MAARLYVYYRVAQPALAPTVATVRQLQAALVAAHPGLRAELLRRPELREGEVTLMETYAGTLPPGFGELLARAASGLPQPRHAECFEPLA